MQGKTYDFWVIRMSAVNRRNLGRYLQENEKIIMKEKKLKKWHQMKGKTSKFINEAKLKINNLKTKTKIR